jgi:hypothetical protein
VSDQFYIKKGFHGLGLDRAPQPDPDDLLDTSLLLLTAIHRGITNERELAACFPEGDPYAYPPGFCEALQKLIDDGLLTVIPQDQISPSRCRSFALTSLGRSVVDLD